MSNLTRRLDLATALLLAAGSVLAQANLTPIVHVETDVVLVPTVVTDKDYRPVFNLREDQFELRVDRNVTSVEGFWKETGPVSVVVVMDASKSMKSALRHSREALQGFLKLAQPEDEYALVLCQQSPSVAIPFTSDLTAFSDSFSTVSPAGSTPLFDSIGLALDLVKQGRHLRRAVLVLSDGADTNSRIKLASLRSKVLESGAYLYVLKFWDGRGYDNLDPRPLHDLAALTGGLFFDDVSPKRFAEYFADIDVHQRYMLAFRSAREEHDNRQHELEVRLRDVTVPKAKVFWRHVYTDSNEPQLR